MADDLEEFFDDFDHYSQEVSLARHQDYARLLRQWLRTLEQAPEPLRTRIAWLKSHFSAERLGTEVIVRGRGMIGSGKLNWPEDLEDRLSSQLVLLDSLTEKEDSAWQFGINFFPVSGNNINGIITEMNQHLFEPHVRELRRYLVKNVDKPVANVVLEGIPAADRIVTLDHNSSAHQDADAALADVEQKVQQVNEGDPEEKERVVAEISAARRLLQATKLRIGALVGLVGIALTWIAAQFAETAVGHAAEWAIAKLMEYLPALSGLF